MPVNIRPSWKKELCKEFEQAYFRQLTAFVSQGYDTNMRYPKVAQILLSNTHKARKRPRKEA